MAKRKQTTKDLYECYVKMQKKSMEGMAALTEHKKSRTRLKRIGKPLSRRQFEKRIHEMMPRERTAYKRFLRKPYEQHMQEGMAEAERLLRAYEENPRVRSRVNREVQTALKKATT